MTAIATGLSTARLRSARAPDGTIYLANGADRPQAWDGLAATARNWGMDAPDSTPTVAAGAAGLPNGTYYYYVAWKNTATGEYSGLSPLSAAITVTNTKVTVTKVSTNNDAQADVWVVFRNTNGETGTFYYVGETAVANATFTDNVDDVTLGAGLVMQDRTKPDGKYPYVANYKGRMWLYGSRTETQGTLATTNGSGTITGTGTAWKSTHKNQKIRIAGDSTVYTISAVASTTSATITPVYAGGTAGGKAFRIYPVRQSDAAWSSASSNEGFAISDSCGIFPNDGDFPSGMAVVGDSLNLFKQNHVYRFSFGADPNPLTGDGQISLALANRGLINNECCVTVGAVAYCLDTQGVYSFDGVAQEQPIDQKIRRLFWPDDGISSSRQVNRTYASTWHGIFNPQSNSICYFVTTGTDTLPKTCLVYDRDRQLWTIYQFDMAITSSCLAADASGQLRAWVGDENGCLWCLAGNRQLEGAATTGTLSGTATAATSSTLTDSLASFQTTDNGLTGVPIRIVSGTGAGQTRIIRTNTGTQVTVSPNWVPGRVPDTTSVYVIGAIESKHHYVNNTFDADARGILRKLAIQFDPVSSNRSFQMRVYTDFQSTPYTDWVPLGNSLDGWEVPSTAYGSSGDGWVTIHANITNNGRCEIPGQINFNTALSVEFRCLDANAPVTIRGFDMQGNALPPISGYPNP